MNSYLGTAPLLHLNAFLEDCELAGIRCLTRAFKEDTDAVCIWQRLSLAGWSNEFWCNALMCKSPFQVFLLCRERVCELPVSMPTMFGDLFSQHLMEFYLQRIIAELDAALDKLSDKISQRGGQGSILERVNDSLWADLDLGVLKTGRKMLLVRWMCNLRARRLSRRMLMPKRRARPANKPDH